MTSGSAPSTVDRFDPKRHVALAAMPWDAAEAEIAIGEIVADALAHLRPDGLWPVHPADDESQDDAACLYLGGTGVVWALDSLARRGVPVTLDLPVLLPQLWAAQRRESEGFGPYGTLPAWLTGDVGLLVLEMRLVGSAAAASRFAGRVEAALTLPVRELMWGLPGAMIASLEAHDLTGEARWPDLYRRAAAILLADLHDSPWGPVWMQDLYGSTNPYLGQVHGYAGNVAALLRGWAWLDDGQREAVANSITRVLPATAQKGPTGVNWPAIAGDAAPATTLQTCHGAPGIVTSLADGPVRSPALDALFIEAGELTWRAGPLAKGSNLCHGTGGNGYAFLRLWRHTGNPVWLDRARAFAMAAIAQCREARRHLGRGRFSLWTGDAGLALYLEACLAGHAAFPTVDPEPAGP